MFCGVPLLSLSRLLQSDVRNKYHGKHATHRTPSCQVRSQVRSQVRTPSSLRSSLSDASNDGSATTCLSDGSSSEGNSNIASVQSGSLPTSDSGLCSHGYQRGCSREWKENVCLFDLPGSDGDMTECSDDQICITLRDEDSCMYYHIPNEDDDLIECLMNHLSITLRDESRKSHGCSS
jgi:hypothetical protein